MSDGSQELFKTISNHYFKKQGSGDTDMAGVFNDMLDVLARMLATQPSKAARLSLIQHVLFELPLKVETYVAAQVAQGDFGKVAPKPDPKSQIVKPTEREQRFVERAKGELK